MCMIMIITFDFLRKIGDFEIARLVGYEIKFLDTLSYDKAIQKLHLEINTYQYLCNNVYNSLELTANKVPPCHREPRNIMTS